MAINFLKYFPYYIPVNTIMRYDFYFKGQGREKAAMAQYAQLKGKKADACENCAGFCEGYCPYHVPVQLLLHAHHTLTLS